MVERHHEHMQTPAMLDSILLNQVHEVRSDSFHRAYPIKFLDQLPYCLCGKICLMVTA